MWKTGTVAYVDEEEVGNARIKERLEWRKSVPYFSCARSNGDSTCDSPNALHHSRPEKILIAAASRAGPCGTRADKNAAYEVEVPLTPVAGRRDAENGSDTNGQ